MILAQGSKSTWAIQLASMQQVEIEGAKLETEGGALIIKDARGALIVAFGPGAWIEVQPE